MYYPVNCLLSGYYVVSPVLVLSDMSMNNINSCSLLTQGGERGVQNQLRLPEEAESIWVLKDELYLTGRKEENDSPDIVNISTKPQS